MATVTINPPNTVRLTGGDDQDSLVNDSRYLVGVAATPGMLAELYAVGTAARYRPHASATNVQPRAVFVEMSMMNKGVDDAYAIGDIPIVWNMEAGDMFWGLIPSGQTINIADNLQSNGDGMLKAATSSAANAGVARYRSLDQLGAVTVTTRCRVEVL